MKYKRITIENDLQNEEIWYGTAYHEERDALPLVVLSIGTATWKTGHTIERKQSKIFGMEYVVSGEVVLDQGQGKHVIGPGEIYLLNQGVNQSYTTGPSGHLSKRFLTLDGPLLNLMLRYTGLWGIEHLRSDSYQSIENLLIQMTDVLRKQAPQASLQLSFLAYQLLVLLGQSVRFTLPAVVEKALDYIQQNLHLQLSSQEICAHVGVSVHHLNRLFAKHMKSSPIKYFLQQKLAWAATLLYQSTLTIQEIAFKVGYDDPLYFSAQFKKQYGLSPKHYRHAMGNMSVMEQELERHQQSDES